MIIDKETIDFCNKNLNLPATGKEQDWELELSDSDRIAEFLSFLSNNSLNSAQRLAVMALIIASYERLFDDGGDNEHTFWRKIKKELLKDKNLYKEVLECWSLEGDDSDGVYSITFLVREFLFQNY